MGVLGEACRGWPCPPSGLASRGQLSSAWQWRKELALGMGVTEVHYKPFTGEVEGSRGKSIDKCQRPGGPASQGCAISIKSSGGPRGHLGQVSHPKGNLRRSGPGVCAVSCQGHSHQGELNLMDQFGSPLDSTPKVHSPSWLASIPCPS